MVRGYSGSLVLRIFQLLSFKFKINDILGGLLALFSDKT
jgi:hypothetical protein